MGLMSLEDVTKEQLKKHNNTHFVMVDGMSKLMNNQVKTCQSSDFIVSGVKWHLLIKSDAVQGYFFIYLMISDEQSLGYNWKVTCNLKYSLVSQTRHDQLSQPFAMYYQAGQQPYWSNNFISYTLLKQYYIVNDKAVFSAEITNVQSSFVVTPMARTMVTAELIKVMEVARKNSRFTWKITQFSSFDGIKHSSYEFTVGSRRWILEMYPKGDGNGPGHLSLYLTATDYVTNGPKSATLAAFKLRVLDQLKRNHHESYMEALFQCPPDPKSSWGFATFLPLGELHNSSRGLLVNDHIYIGVEFLFVSTTEYL